jgi:large subunit ribosomal protein L32e
VNELPERKSEHHDEFMKLHMFKEEYVEKLEAIGITSPEELAEALEDDERTKEVHEHLKGAGEKTIAHWKEDLGVISDEEPDEAEAETAEQEPEKAPAKKVRKVKAPAKKPSETKEVKKEGKKEKTAEGEKKTEKKEDEEVEIEEEEGYKVKLKPKLSKETLKALKIRAGISARRPEFLRQEWHKRPRLQNVKWRKPQGDQSKMRQHYGYRMNIVSIGFGGPRAARYLHPSGFREVMVHNVKDLAKIHPEVEAARVGHSVGYKKRLEIEEKADELKIRILNRSG